VFEVLHVLHAIIHESGHALDEKTSALYVPIRVCVCRNVLEIHDSFIVFNNV
jgi:hypothetical protein